MKSKFILVLAIIMGFITTLLFYNYMKSVDTTKNINNHLKDIVIAKQSIQKNQQISSDMITIAQVPEMGLPPGTIKTLSDATGKFATADIAPKEPLLSHRLSSEKEESIFVSRKVRDGYRAVSVGVNFVQSVSNLIEPEDWVDVIFSEVQPRVGDYTPVRTEIILEKVRVLAVGRKMLESTPEDTYVEYSSVTLELNQSDVIKLVNAKERGNIQLILHSRVIPSK
ncbi:Flp pilus assembly protein CpaB [Clostridiaceae bacterium 35-E11]